MKYFNVKDVIDNESCVCVTFKKGDNYQSFLNYLSSLKDDNRYNGEVVDIEDYPSFRSNHIEYFSVNKEYNYAYNYFLPYSVVRDYLKLMED
jgi:hypothetical protein